MQHFGGSQRCPPRFVRREPYSQAEHKIFVGLALRCVERFDRGDRVVDAARGGIHQPQLLLQPRQFLIGRVCVTPIADFSFEGVDQR